jgi:hypothetical protein
MFTQTPPVDLVTHVLKTLGIDDMRWFSKEELSLETLEDWLPLIEPYYLPCKASRYLDSITKNRIITVLRHLLKATDGELKYQERVINGKKITVYQVFQRILNPVVTFD